MRIGRTIEVETNVPRPHTVEPIRRPSRPEREPVRVPVRREPQKVESTARQGMSGRLLLYECPRCGRELEEMELADGVILTCPVHGPVQELARN